MMKERKILEHLFNLRNLLLCSNIFFSFDSFHEGVIFSRILNKLNYRELFVKFDVGSDIFFPSRDNLKLANLARARCASDRALSAECAGKKKRAKNDDEEFEWTRPSGPRETKTEEEASLKISTLGS